MGSTEIYKAIMRAQKNISPPPKNKKAMYGKYADLESVMTAVREPLSREGLFITQTGVHEDGANYLRTVLTHAETGEQIHSDIPLVSKDERDPQKLGGSITYARRYGIVSLLAIVADDDDDGNTSAGKQADGRPAPKPKVTPEQVQQVLAVENPLEEKFVKGLITQYQRAGITDDKVMMSEIRKVIGRDFSQLAELTEAEARTANGHAKKLQRKDEDEEREGMSAGDIEH